MDKLGIIIIQDCTAFVIIIRSVCGATHKRMYYTEMFFFLPNQKTGGEFLFLPPIIYLLPSTPFIYL